MNFSPMIRSGLFTAFACLAAACATAPPPAATADPAAVKGRKPEADRPFVERSLVLAPAQVAELTRTKMNDYPGDPASGIGIRYAHPDFPEARIDLFVYIRGRSPRDEALDEGMAAMRQSLEQAAAQGGYTDLVMEDPEPFSLDAVAADGSVLPVAPPPVAPAPAGTDFDARLLAALASADPANDPANDPAVGRILRATLRISGEAMNSRAFVFYRGLYYYKVRVSISPLQLPGEAFERFANHVAAVLVPAVQVRSTGGCADNTVYVDKDLDSEAMALQLGEQLARSQARSARENCATSLDETVPDGFQALPLVYPDAFWRR